MATRGYSSYRGRTSGKKIGIIIALAVVLLAAVAFLVAQEYVVYDDTGKAHVELPFLQKDEAKSEKEEPSTPVPDEDVVIERQEPEPTVHSDLTEIHAVRFPAGCLWWTPADVLAMADDSFAVSVKYSGGNISYGTSVSVPAGTTVEQGRTLDTLKTFLASDKYAIAWINAFNDSSYASKKSDCALKDNARWLDPANKEVQAYITALCKECAKLGFEEIVLEDFSYPADYKGDNAGEVLTAFAQKLRKALPEDIVLSIVVSDEATISVANDNFDRLYVADTALSKKLPDDFEKSRLVTITDTAPKTGSYITLK